MSQMSLPSSKENTGSKFQESVSYKTRSTFFFSHIWRKKDLQNFSQLGKATDPFATTNSKEKESLAHQKVVQPRAEKDTLVPQRICQDMLHMTCFLLPPKTSEMFEEKEKACCDCFENAAGLSILLVKE